MAKWSLKSRLALLLLQVRPFLPNNLLFNFPLPSQVLLHNVIPDHPGSMEDVFMKVHRFPEHPFLVERLLGGLDNWDAEYFIFNAHTGYLEHEHTMAFFPLLPGAMWVLSRTLFLPLSFLLPQRSIMLVSGVFLNLTAFPLATVVLYLLTFEVSRDKRLAVLAAGLFSLSPASVFMCAVYSETFFALFTFSGLLALEKHHRWLSCAAFSMATLTRSNGIVLCGFLGYKCLSDITETLFYQSYWTFRRKVQTCARYLGATALQCLITVAPFCGFQLYGYVQYCRRSPTMSLSSSSPPVWCNHTLPLPYSFIQDHYWNFGFMRYYEFKQIPNFLLAAPMVALVLLCARGYFRDRGVFAPPKVAGARRNRDRKMQDYSFPDTKSTDTGTEQDKAQSTAIETKHDRTQDGTQRAKMQAVADRTGVQDAVRRTEQDEAQTTSRDYGARIKPLVNMICTSRLRPYMFHLLFLTAFGVLNMHVQVSTLLCPHT